MRRAAGDWLAIRVIALVCILLPTFTPGQAMADTREQPTRARKQLEQVLEQPAFRQWRRRANRAAETDSPLLPDSWQHWIEDTARRTRDWIGDWFDDGSSQPSANPGASSGGGIGLASMLEVLGWTLLAAVTIFVLVALIRLFVSFSPKRSEPAVTRQRLHEAMASGEALAAESPQWLAEADQLAAEQDLRRAYRALYLALLSGLHHSRLIDFRPNRTNWMYVRQYRGDVTQRHRLAQLTEQFDAVWYGRRRPEPQAMEQARQQVRQLLGHEVRPGQEPRA